MPGLARGTRFQTLVGGVVIDEFLGSEIEFEFSSKAGCGVGQVTERIAGHRGFNGRYGLRTAFDAIEEVSSVARAMDQALL